MKKYLFRSILLIGIITYLSNLTLTSQASPMNETDIQQTTNKQGNQIKQKELRELKQELKDEGVSKEDRDKLIKKLEDGQLWDSMNPKYQNIEPQIKSKNYSKTIYPDGSYNIISVEESSPEVLEQNSKQDNTLLQKELKELRNELKKQGVNKKNRDKLIKKLEDGQLWDSMNPKYQNIEPQIKSKNYSKTIYPDGSYNIIITEESSSEILEQGILRFIYPTIQGNLGQSIILPIYTPKFV